MTAAGPSNAYHYHPGIGTTPEESKENASYWANQLPWVKTVPYSRTPKWAIEQAMESYEQSYCPACGEKSHHGVCIDTAGYKLPGRVIELSPWRREFIMEEAK